MGRDSIRQAARLIDTGQGGQYLCRHFLAEVHILLKLGDGRAQQGLHLPLRNFVADHLTHAGDGKIPFIVDAVDNRPVATFNQDLYRPVRQLE